MQSKRIDAQPRRPAKVVGVGAPISVMIRFERIEIPALTAAIAEELNRFNSHAAANGSADAWADHIGELRRMQADVDRSEASTAATFMVTWPTVLAHGVLHAAIRHAEQGAPAVAAQQTCDDFDEVDGGGPDAVWL